MSKPKLSPVARIREYFTTAPLAEAKVMRDLALDIVRERVGKEEPQPIKTPVKRTVKKPAPAQPKVDSAAPDPAQPAPSIPF